MKLATNTVEVQSNITYDETFRVGIADDSEAVAMVIERLISAYENPYRAALREYTSNAYDEHVQAGVSRPVEVSLPSSLSPILKIQDFGRGLSREGLKGFGTIGKSTKRDSNETTGGFGMGSKCALAAAPQFTVVSVKDGKRNTVIVARDENNIPHMNFLAETETDDESGTTVIIPITSSDKFGDLSNFWIAWPKGSILVDDEAPRASLFDPTQYRDVADGKGYYNLSNATSGRDNIRVVINQVYYELPYQKLGLDYKQWNILKYYVLRLDNGTVEIAPSRETLLFNARTKAAVAERTEELLMLARDEHARTVDAAASVALALEARDKMYAAGYPTDGLTWKGKRIVLPGMIVKGNRVPSPSGTWVRPITARHTKVGWIVEKSPGHLGDRSIWKMNKLTSRSVIVYGCAPAIDYGTGRRQRSAHPEVFKTADWLNAQDGANQLNWDIFFTAEPRNRLNRWVLDCASVVISAEEFEKTAAVERAARLKAEREAKAGIVKSTKLAVLVSSNYGVGYSRDMSVEDIQDEFKNTVILRNQEAGVNGSIREAMTTKKHWSTRTNTFVSSIMRKTNTAVILVGKNDKLDSVLSLLPNVTTFEALAAKLVEESYVSSTKIEQMALRDRENGGVGSIQCLSDLMISKIKRKETREWALAVKNHRDTGAPIRETLSIYRHQMPALASALDAGTVSTKGKLPESPMNRYPMLKHVGYVRDGLSDIVDYINMMDARKKA